MTPRMVVHGDGRLIWRAKTYHAALGAAGIARDKREGDKATPVGIFPLRRVLYRPDRLDPPRTRSPSRPSAPRTAGATTRQTRSTTGR